MFRVTKRPPRLAGWLEGIWSVTWPRTSDFPGALQWDEAAEPTQFTGWGKHEVKTAQRATQPGNPWDKVSLFGETVQLQMWPSQSISLYRLTVDNQMIGYWFFDFFPFCQWQFLMIIMTRQQDMLEGHGRRQFWPETQWCVTGLMVGGWTGGGDFEASTPSFTNAPSLPPVSSPGPLVLGLGVVSIVLSLMKLGTALEYFCWQLTHFLK